MNALDDGWLQRDDSSFPRSAFVDDNSLLLTRGARRLWSVPTSTSADEGLAALDADDAPIFGMSRFTPTLAPDAAWAPFRGGLWFAPAQLTRTPLQELPTSASDVDVDVDVDDLDGHRFLASVQGALAACAAGLDKVVVARRFRVHLPNAFAQVPRLFGALRGCDDDGVPFLVSPCAGVAWLGRSPERLLLVQDGVVTTEAVAGTQRGPGGPSDSALLLSAKDAREQALVVEHLLEKLRGLQLRPEAGPRGVRRLAHLTHLLTTVRASLSRDALPGDVDIAALVKALHPTPALAGRPVAAALEALATLEGFDRGGYGGVVGFVSPKRTALSVALRGVLVNDDGLLLTVGAGIVAGSTPAQEDEETRLKARAVLASLGLRARGDLAAGGPR